MRMLLCTYAVFFGISAFSGPHIIGNGGNALVCDQVSKKKIILLDFFEAQNLLGLSIKLDINASTEKIVDALIDRLNFSQKFNIEKIKLWSSQFNNEARFLSDVELSNTEDSFHLVVPKNCKIEQLVIQKEPEMPGDKRYTINKDIWDLLDNVSKAGIILHELTYRQMIENFGSGLNINSIPVRYMLAYLASDTLKDLNAADLSKLEEQLGFNSASEASQAMILVKNKWVSNFTKSNTGVLIQYELEFSDEKTARFSSICRTTDILQLRNLPDLKVSIDFTVDIKNTAITNLEAKHKVIQNTKGVSCGVSIEKSSSQFKLLNRDTLLIIHGIEFNRFDL